MNSEASLDQCKSCAEIKPRLNNETEVELWKQAEWVPESKEWNENWMSNEVWMNGNRQCWKDWLNAAIAVDEGSIKAWMNEGCSRLQ